MAKVNWGGTPYWDASKCITRPIAIIIKETVFNNNKMRSNFANPASDVDRKEVYASLQENENTFELTGRHSASILIER